MNLERVHEQRLRTLDYWRGPVTIEPLPGGITNRNFLVRDDGLGRSFVARLGEERPLLGIDRRNEVTCQRAAWGLGVAPEVVHQEEGILISAFLEARTLNAEEVREPVRLDRLAKVVRTLHDGWDGLAGMTLYFSAFQTVRTYAQTARELEARLPEDLDRLLDDARGLARRIAPFTPVLCHNDLLPANLLEETSSGRIRIVDWEYAGVGHPMFDLANIASNSGLSDEAEEALLAPTAARSPGASLANCASCGPSPRCARPSGRSSRPSPRTWTSTTTATPATTSPPTARPVAGSTASSRTWEQTRERDVKPR